MYTSDCDGCESFDICFPDGVDVDSDGSDPIEQKEQTGMISITNDYFGQLMPDAIQSSDIEPGSSFFGTATDVDGEDATGVFVKTFEEIVFLDAPQVIFPYDVEVSNFHYIDIDVTVSGIV